MVASDSTSDGALIGGILRVRNAVVSRLGGDGALDAPIELIDGNNDAWQSLCSRRFRVVDVFPPPLLFRRPLGKALHSFH